MHAVMLRREEALPLPALPLLPSLPLPAVLSPVTVESVPVPQQKKKEEDIPYPLPDNEEEDRRRLNAGHYALKTYLGGNYIAPLTSRLSQGPSDVLDLGTGSGIWAIEMAEEFPLASVMGVDITTVAISSQHIPSNCRFQVANLAQEWPFPEKTFDVIHSRFCLVHLPNPRQILENMLRSLRPSGFLLLEEGTNALFATPSPSHPLGLPEGIQTFYDIYGRIMRERAVDGEVGPKMLSWVRESGECEVVCERVLRPPMQPFTKGKALNDLGETLKQFLIKGYTSMIPRLASQGITEEVVRGFVEGVQDPERRVTGRLNWVWARKKAEEEE